MLDVGSVGPVNVPPSGLAIASAYFFSTGAAPAFTQDPAFTEIASADADNAGTSTRRVVWCAFRARSGSQAYDPTPRAHRRVAPSV